VPFWTDISVAIKPGMIIWPGNPKVDITKLTSIDKGDVYNSCFMRMGLHTGTHMDAPRHFIAKGKSLDQMPLDVVIGLARIIEIKDENSIKPEELRQYWIKKGERILFKTRSSALWKKSAFSKDYVYITPEAAKYLVSLGVSLVGIDYLSVGSFLEDGIATHQILLGGGIWVIEGLNLTGIKAGNYDLICLPLKIENSDGASARAIIRKI